MSDRVANPKDCDRAGLNAMIDATSAAGDPVLLATLRLLNVCRSCPLDETDGTYRGDQMLWHELWWALEDRHGRDLHDTLNRLERLGLA